jgi:5-methylcytosine-specific restriction endonuclease McrA
VRHKVGYTKPETRRRYREEHKEEIIAYSREYRQTHKKERAALQRGYNERHKDALAVKAKKYRADHAEELREYFRVYHEARRENRNARARVYHASHATEIAVVAKAWLAANRERVRQNQRAYGAIRRSSEANLPATFTEADWADVLDLFGHKCAYCGKDGKLHQDHFVPVTRGGGYELGNIVPACHSCNSRKNAKDPLAWLGLRRWLDTLETAHAV